ncbi:hypothetical protein QJQ45_026963 [Haematococcus lacustris]|nr:hypothetical protein QJQ45_026963 [Haematococcus lacustris]
MSPLMSNELVWQANLCKRCMCKCRRPMHLGSLKVVMRVAEPPPVQLRGRVVNVLAGGACLAAGGAALQLLPSLESTAPACGWVVLTPCGPGAGSLQVLAVQHAGSEAALLLAMVGLLAAALHSCQPRSVREASGTGQQPLQQGRTTLIRRATSRTPALCSGAQPAWCCNTCRLVAACRALGLFSLRLTPGWAAATALLCLLLFPAVDPLAASAWAGLLQAALGPGALDNAGGAVLVAAVQGSWQAGAAGPLALHALASGLLGPLWEEVFWRGFFLTSLTKVLPLPACVAASSLGFAALHLTPSNALPLLLLAPAGDLLYLRSRSLGPSLMLHAAWNLGQLLAVALGKEAFVVAQPLNLLRTPSPAHRAAAKPSVNQEALPRVPVPSAAAAAADDLEHGHGMMVPAAVPPPPGVRANPGPFGLLCFGMTTCMLMFTTTKWSPGGFLPVVVTYAAFFGGFGQLVAGILELIRGATCAGTAFSCYGCFWLGWFLWKLLEIQKTVASVTATALTGDTLWCGLWAVFTLCFFVVTLRKNKCLQVVFASLTLTFILLAGANYSDSCKLAAGYVGFFCGSSAIYAAIAMLYQEELGWTLPGLRPTNYLEEDMEVSMQRHGHAKQLVFFFGAATIGTRGGWGADAVLRACCKVVCRPRGTDQRRGRVVLVDEHRTSRVSSAVNGQQPCERQLNKRRATRSANWKPPAGQVEQRLLRPAWSQQRDQPVRGMMWCPVVAPRKPPQAPRSSQAATQAAASEAGPSTPLPAKRSKRTKAEPEAAEPTKGKGKAVKAKPAPQQGRWLDRDCNAALNMQRNGESKWRPLELCFWPEQGRLPAKGKEYPGLGYKRLRDKPPQAQEQQPALEEGMEELSMKRHGHAKQLVVFFGAATIGTRGGWGADAVLRACRKVVCRPRGKDQDGGRVVLVDEHRTSRVNSAVNGKQPCEVELNTLSATRPAGWRPPAGQVEQRLVRPAWSQERGQPVRGLVWCPVVAPRRPPQAPHSSQAATPAAASEPGTSTPQPAKRSKRTKAEPGAAEPIKGKGKAAKAKPAPQPGRWLDRDCNAALNMQRIGESRWRPLELCFWPEQGRLPAKGKEYPGLGYKRLRDKPPKAQEQQPAVAQ